LSGAAFGKKFTPLITSFRPAGNSDSIRILNLSRYRPARSGDRLIVAG